MITGIISKIDVPSHYPFGLPFLSEESEKETEEDDKSVDPFAN